jgi:nitrate reductase NapD
MNVSSLVVKVLPADMELALAALAGSGLCEVHAHDREKGSIVVTIEGRNVGEEMDKMKAIEKLPHVLGAALVYAASEDAPAAAGGPVPGGLANA